MQAPSPEEEVDLVAGLRRGEAAAFDRAYARYRPRVYGFLRRLAGGRELAEDLFQETWIQLATHATRLAPDTNLGGWLFTVARNRFRSYRRWILVDDRKLRALGLAAEERDQDPSPEHHAALGEQERRLERALAALRDADRELLLLVAVEELPQEQVAAMLGVRHDALRQRLARARARLAEQLAEERP